jgi:hypothetical protein
MTPPIVYPAFPLADHRPARDAFEELIAPNPPLRILLLHGPQPESGKTRLLDHCFAKPAFDVDNVRIDMKEVAHPADELLQMLWLKFRDRLPHLAAARRDRAGPLVQVANNWQIGVNRMSVAITVDPETERSGLIEAFFVDAAELSTPFLIAIDSFERSSQEVKHWVAGPFLTRVAQAKAVRVVIAGREVPEVSGRWSAYCGPVQRLEPVTQPNDWKLVIGEMGRRLESADPDGTLAEVCRFAGKNTSRLMSWIEHSLPPATIPT